jgi:DNA-binding FadR family transcriptional regulator
MRDYDVSRTVPKMAINVLRSEGLITSHPGKGRTRRLRDHLGHELDQFAA